MPYFERKPWSAPQHNSKPPQDTVDVDMVQVAESILMSEAQRPHAIEGPFRARRPVQPGGSTYLVLQIENSDGDDAITLNMMATDLRSKSGDLLSASLIDISPSQITLTAGNSKPVKISVSVPSSANPGTYSGRIKASGSELIDFIVEFEVLPAN